jgi:two-component system sensor histidine kinase GlrK
LTFIGFTVVTLPLIAALVMALLNVDSMVRQSQSVIYQATQAMQLSQQLVKELTELERYARQYLVLGDADVWALYLEEHEEFTEIAIDLRQLSLGPNLEKPLSEMISIEQALYAWLHAGLEQKDDSTLATRYFSNLSSLGELLLLESSENIWNKADNIQNHAETTKKLLLWQSIVLIPVALFIALIFTILITKPLRQLGRSIHDLGSGHFEVPVTITGPRDISHLGERLEWLRNRLTDLEAQKTSVLRNISHDLKTPLTALREGTELLSDNTLGTLNPTQREIASILKTNCLKLQKQVEDLLSFGASQQHLESNITEIIKIPSLLREVLTAHKLEIQSKQLKFKGHLVDCEVLGDPTQLRAIFDNLFSNAIKYSPNNGKISAVLRIQGCKMVLDLLDQGPGIDSLDKDRLFDPYFQGKITSQGPIKGTGLGLAIAQEFARLHQGIIEVINNSAGAHFRLTLPLEN